LVSALGSVNPRWNVIPLRRRGRLRSAGVTLARTAAPERDEPRGAGLAPGSRSLEVAPGGANRAEP